MLRLHLFSMLLTLFCTFILRGQSSAEFPNLVVNPSFEELAKGQSTQSVAVIDTIKKYKGWSSPTKGQSAVYGTNKNGWIEDNTENPGQRDFKARTGQHVARLTAYKANKIRWYNRFRSYLQTKLTDSMIVGQKYYIGFWSHVHCLATNNICMAFSTDYIQSDTIFQLNLTPKARLKTLNNYDAKNIWSLTVDSFIADKPYKYCIIGNFLSDDSTRIGGSKDFDHYITFVDDVFVVKAKNRLIPPRKEIMPPKPPIPETPIKLKTSAPLPKVLNKVQFLYNSADFEPNSLPQLDSAVVVLKNYPTLEILIKGHTSSEGEADYNQKLSEKRAEAVKNYLIQHGIDAKRLSSKGFGESQLLVTDDSEEHKRMNRRIEFAILRE
jgi:hypothetical protein